MAVTAHVGRAARLSQRFRLRPKVQTSFSTARTRVVAFARKATASSKKAGSVRCESMIGLRPDPRGDHAAGGVAFSFEAEPSPNHHVFITKPSNALSLTGQRTDTLSV